MFFSPDWLNGFPWGLHHPTRSGYNLDCWDGYPAARARLLAAVPDARVRNLAILTSDWHSHWAADVHNLSTDLESSPLGVELVTSSISSNGDGEPQPEWSLRSLAAQPYLRHFDQRRGWIKVQVTAQQLRADFRVVAYVSRPGAPEHSSGAFVVGDGTSRIRPA